MKTKISHCEKKLARLLFDFGVVNIAVITMGLDRTYHVHQFIFSFSVILIFCSFRVVDKAGYPSAFYCTLNTPYRIVLYRNGRLL